MIIRSLSLIRRLERETMRHVGSYGELVFYSGTMPANCDAAADGEKIATELVTEALLRDISRGHEPALPEKAMYWRVLSNEGLVSMQGDGKL